MFWQDTTMTTSHSLTKLYNSQKEKKTSPNKTFERETEAKY